MNRPEIPIEPMAPTESDEEVFESPEINEEILEGFFYIVCSYCKKSKLEVIGGMKTFIIGRCSDCGGLTFIHARQEEKKETPIKTEKRRDYIN